MFSSGLAVVLDLVGPDPFERFGRRMSSWTLQKARGVFGIIFFTLQLVGIVIGFLMFYAAYLGLGAIITQAGGVKRDLPDFAYTPEFVLTAVVLWGLLSLIGAWSRSVLIYLATTVGELGSIHFSTTSCGLQASR